MEVPPWDGSSVAPEYPAAAGRAGPKGKKSKRKHDLKRRKELNVLVSKTVVVPPSSAEQKQGSKHLQGQSGAALGEATIISSQGTRSTGEGHAEDQSAAQQLRPRHSQPIQHTNAPESKAQSTSTARKRARAQQVQSQPDHFAGRADASAKPHEQSDSAIEQSGAAEPEVRQPDSKRKKKKSSAGNVLGSALPHEAAVPVSLTRPKVVLQHADRRADLVPASSAQVGKHKKQQGTAASSPPAPHAPAAKHGIKRQSGLLDKMRSKLQGGRFRWLNEQLYTQPGEQAFQLMHSDPEMFQEYHEGFQEQVRHWPEQPLHAAAHWVRSLPASAAVADFGCGTAQLAAQVAQQVQSLDLVAAAPGVVACDMAHTPLGNASMDAAVFCLALMGTNYGAFLAEAARVLKPKGQLWVAEVRSRFALADGSEDHEAFCTALQQTGFKMLSKDISNKMFVVFVARKHRSTVDVAAVRWPVLKPCQYKRR